MDNPEFLDLLAAYFKPTVTKDTTRPVGSQYVVRAGWQDKNTGAQYTIDVNYPYWWTQRLVKRISSLILLQTIVADYPDHFGENNPAIRNAAEWLDKKVPRGEM